MASRYGPTIDATGISAPDFPTVQANLIADAQAIFGTDIVLDNSTKDGQLIGVFAKAISDCNSGCIAAFNAYSPTKAQGAGLSSSVKLNGLKRKVPSNSTVDLTLVGVAGRTITNGQASDDNSTASWLLPATVTFPGSGTIVVTATCATVGAITAAPGTITKIKTQVSGWQTVTNVAAAVPGQPVESDPVLRIRQSQSTSLPAQTVFDGTVAKIQQLAGVTRVKGYENNTASVNGLGIAANSLAFIVEGGLNTDIFGVLFLATPGIPQAGAQTQTFVSPATGSTKLVAFDRPTNATIHVALTIKAQAGWSVGTEPIIAQAVADYINALPVGGVVGFLDLVVPARLTGTPYYGTYRITAITLAKNAGGASAADIVLAYNEAAIGTTGNVTFTVT